MATKEQIDLYMDETIRPYIRGHGGDIEVVSLEDGVLAVRLTGSCSGCPAATLSTREFIKQEIAKRFPQVSDIEVESKISPDMLDFARKLLKHD